MKSFLALILFIVSNGLFAQKIDHRLEKMIAELVKDFNGDIGIYVHDLKNNKIASIQGDTTFPTASIVKIPILVGIMNKINNGELAYHQQMTYKDSLFYSEGDDMLASYKNDEKIELSKVIMLMMSTSDNAASLWLQGLSGGGATINKQMENLGLMHTRVNSRTEGRRDDWKMYGWGQTTPKEMTSLMKMVVDNKIINRAYSERMLRIMGRQMWDEHALAEIPPNVFVASKNGAVNASRSEVLYVNGGHPYIFTICTKNNKDQTWQPENEAWQLTRKLSAMLWKYYHPKSEWQPLPLIK